VEPSRAAIIYLSEPIFAAAFAWVSEGAAMSAMALCGAGLILVANMIAELRWPRRRRMTVTPAKAT
jgi:drug/metabolite transporter (DMT)-like permease